MALVLCAGADPILMKTRKLILELAGHTVVSTRDESEITAACKHNHFEVAIIGQSVPPEKKRLVAGLLRQGCPSAKILELFAPYQGVTIENADSWLEMPSDPKELVRHVTKLANAEASDS